jgi:hypothetical protein
MGTLKRFTAVAGLFGIAWIGYTLVRGEVTLLDAGVRAASIFGAVVVVSWIMGLGLRTMARSLERV